MSAARSKHLEIDDLARLRFPCEAQISPDGKRTVYVETRITLDTNRYHHALVVVDVDAGRRRALTDGTASDTSPSWTPDSQRVVFISDRSGNPNLWSVDRRGSELRQLTALDGIVRTPRVSPDGTRVVFVHAPRTPQQRRVAAGPDRPEPRFRHIRRLGWKLDGHGYWDGAWLHLWVLDLRTGKSKRLTSGDFHDRQPAWSPDGRHLAFVSNRVQDEDMHPFNSDVFVVSARGGRPRELTRALGPKMSPSWSPDGRGVAYIGHHRYPDTVENHHVWVVSRRGGSRDLVAQTDLMCANLCISDVRDVPEGNAPTPRWSADGKRVRFLASREGTVNLYEVPTTGGSPKPLSNGKHEIVEFSQSRDGKRLVFVRADAKTPGDVYVARFMRGAGRGSMIRQAAVRRLTRINSAPLRDKQLQQPTDFRVRARGGHETHGWVLHARGRKRRGPAVLMVHGGPHAMYGWTFFHEFQMLAAAGYHVFFTNIRGSAGYGNDYMRAIVGRWGHDDFRDLSDVADWIQSRPFVDPGRIAIAGGSYGGLMTNWAIGHTNRFKCAISMRSVVNMTSMYGTSDLGWFLHEEFSTHPWESAERYWRGSPLAFVERIRTPLLILHSDQDLRCPASQAEELFVALRLLKRDVEMVQFLGENHGLSRSGRPHNRLERLRRILDWLERKL
jgi:dipeptidyl aminopeptidase/acylaminoacyl peptidase